MNDDEVELPEGEDREFELSKMFQDLKPLTKAEHDEVKMQYLEAEAEVRRIYGLDTEDDVLPSDELECAQQ